MKLKNITKTYRVDYQWSLGSDSLIVKPNGLNPSVLVGL